MRSRAECHKITAMAIVKRCSTGKRCGRSCVRRSVKKCKPPEDQPVMCVRGKACGKTCIRRTKKCSTKSTNSMSAVGRGSRRKASSTSKRSKSKTKTKKRKSAPKSRRRIRISDDEDNVFDSESDESWFADPEGSDEWEEWEESANKRCRIPGGSCKGIRKCLSDVYDVRRMPSGPARRSAYSKVKNRCTTNNGMPSALVGRISDLERMIMG